LKDPRDITQTKLITIKARVILLKRCQKEAVYGCHPSAASVCESIPFLTPRQCERNKLDEITCIALLGMPENQFANCHVLTIHWLIENFKHFNPYNIRRQCFKKAGKNFCI
jgi:hypothetical protein